MEYSFEPFLKKYIHKTYSDNYKNNLPYTSLLLTVLLSMPYSLETYRNKKMIVGSTLEVLVGLGTMKYNH